MRVFFNKKFLTLFAAIVLASFFGKVVFAAWNGTFYNPGDTLNPECSPTEADCDVRAPLTAITGATLDQTTPQTIGTTGARLTKLWATDLSVTNTIDGSISGNAATVSNGVYTNAANVFTQVNPLTTAAESWIGPSSTAGIYFKGGNVGIGTTVPAAPLHVSGTGGLLRLERSSSSALPQFVQLYNPETTNGNGLITAFYMDSTGAGATPLTLGGYMGMRVNTHNHTTRNTDFVFGTSNGGSPVERVTITGAGNVGIGTTSPSQPLHVEGSTPSIVVKSTSGTFKTYLSSGANGSYIGANINPFNATLDDTTKAGWTTGWNIDVASYYINYYSAGAGARTASNYFIINSLGNVGIGATSPGNKLDVLTGGGTDAVRIMTGTDVAEPAIEFWSGHTNAGERNWRISTSRIQYGDFNILQSNALGGDPLTAGTNRFYINNSGNVGIGTTTPEGKLQVAGSVTGANYGYGISNTASVTAPTLNSYGLYNYPTLINSTTGQIATALYSGGIVNAGTGLTINNAYSIYANGLTKTGTGTITNTYGLYVAASTAGTNNYGAYIAGSVGIGTTAPATTLHLIHSSGTSGWAYGSTPAGLLVENGGSSNGAYIAAFASVAAKPALVITNAGNVGIGTAVPLKTLDVAGGGRFTGKASSTLTGTADPTASTTLVGTGTLFTTELVVGDRITINAETRTVTAIASDTSLTVDSAFTDTAAASITKLSAIFLARDSSNAVKFAINDLGNIGIGTTAPVSKLSITDETAVGTRGMTISQNDTSAAAALMNFRKSRGTAASPTIVVNGDYTAGFNAQNYDGSAYLNNGSFGYKVNGTVAAGSIPGEWFFAASATTDTNPYSNGSVRMVINSSGNVGIGDTTPYNKLVVSGTSVGAAFTGLSVVNNTPYGVGVGLPTARMTFNHNNGTGSAAGEQAYIEGGNSVEDSSSNGYLALGTRRTNTLTEAMRILSSGNVGIGTTAPTSALHVANSSGLAVAQIDGNAASGGILRFMAGGSNKWYVGTNTSSADLGFYNYTTSTAAMFLQGSNGNVGIGTTAPNARLEVNGGDVYIWDSNSDPRFLVGDSSAGGNFGGFRWNSASDLVQVGTDTGGYVLNLDEAGNVGIGTTAPLKTLDVAGGTRVTGNTSSTLTGTADPAASVTLTGTGTLFTTELVVGDRITINAETRTVTAISSNTSLTVDSAFTDTAAASITKLPAIFLARDSGGTVRFNINDLGNVGVGGYPGSSYALLVNGTMGISSTGQIQIASYNTVLKENYLQLYGANGAKLSSDVNGVLSLGTNSATPAAQYINLAPSARGGTDTDVTGANIYLRPGNGTGTGGSGRFVFQTAPVGTTGTTANTMGDRWYLNNAGNFYPANDNANNIGGVSNRIVTVYSLAFSGGQKTGTDQAGNNITIQPDNGTGTGGSGSILFKTAPVGTTGTTANTMATRVTIDNVGTTAFGTPGSELVFIRGSVSKAISFNRNPDTGTMTDANSFGYQLNHIGSATAANDLLKWDLYTGAGASQGTIMALTGEGKVGIGTISPSSILHARATATASSAEVIATFGVSDDTNSNFQINNASSTDSIFMPRMSGINSSTYTALTLQGIATTDTGTDPVTIIKSTNSGGAAIATRPTFAFVNGGTTQLLINSSGKVGIGTTEPVSRLHVGVAPTASANYGTLSLGSGYFDGSTTGKFIGSSSGTSLAVNEVSGYAGDLINLQTAGVMAFKVSAGGVANFASSVSTQVGYFTTIRSYGAGTGAITINGKYASLDTAGDFVNLAEGTLTNTSGASKRVSINSVYNQVGSTASNTDLLINRTETAVGNGAQYLIDAQVGSVSKFNVTNTGQGYFAGNVGIGTTAPTHALEVSSSSGVLLSTNSSSGKPASGGQALRVHASTSTVTAPVFTIHSNVDSAGAEKFRVQADGNVGIGTTAPVKALDVVNGMKVKNAAGTTLTGTADPDGTATLTGTGTLFLTELSIGDQITVNAEQRLVTAIASNTSLTVSQAFTNTASAAITKQPAAFVSVLSGGTLGPVIGSLGEFTMQNNVSIGALLTTGIRANLLYYNSSNQAVFGANSEILTSGSISLQPPSGGNITIQGGATDGATAVGTLFNTRNTLSTAGAKLVKFMNASNEKAYIDKDGGAYFGTNVMLGGTAVRATTAGTNQLIMFDGTAPVGTLANGVSIYSEAGELKVMDAAGNATLLSPHENIYNYWVFNSSNTETGKSLLIDMELVIKDINDSFGLDYVHETQDGELVERPLPGENSLLSKMLARVAEWMADSMNGIAKIFSNEIETKNLCVSNDAGEKTCISKEQLDALILNIGGSSSASSSSGSTSSSTEPSSSPATAETSSDPAPISDSTAATATTDPVATDSAPTSTTETQSGATIDSTAATETAPATAVSDTPATSTSTTSADSSASASTTTTSDSAPAGDSSASAPSSDSSSTTTP